MLDTSFWTVGFKVGLLGYAMKLFDIVVPKAVADEIRARDRLYPHRLYPDTVLFDQVCSLFQPPPRPEPAPIDQFGSGEAAAIPLAHSLGAALLINDRRPAQHARNLGLVVVTAPGMVVVARSQQFIADHVARAMLRTCSQHGTSPELVQEALAVLASLS